jgi:hypothetical protein
VDPWCCAVGSEAAAEVGLAGHDVAGPGRGGDSTVAEGEVMEVEDVVFGEG